MNMNMNTIETLPTINDITERLGDLYGFFYLKVYAVGSKRATRLFETDMNGEAHLCKGFGSIPQCDMTPDIEEAILEAICDTRGVVETKVTKGVGDSVAMVEIKLALPNMGKPFQKRGGIDD